MQLGECADFLRTFIWSRVSGLMRFLTADQKQQCIRVCKERRQIASNDAIFLFRVITGDESWIYDDDPETKKATILPTEKSKFAESKVKSMRIMFFDKNGTKILPWQAKQSIPRTTAMFYDGCVKMCKNFTPNFATKGLLIA
jgi:hypothetical protein